MNSFHFTIHVGPPTGTAILSYYNVGLITRDFAKGSCETPTALET